MPRSLLTWYIDQQVIYSSYPKNVNHNLFKNSATYDIQKNSVFTPTSLCFVQIGSLNCRPLLFDPHRSTVTIHSRSFLSDCITHGERTAVIHSRWAERELTNRKRHQHHRLGVSKKPERYMPPICIHTEKYTPSLQGNGSRWHYRSRSCLCSMEIITFTVKQFLIPVHLPRT